MPEYLPISKDMLKRIKETLEIILNWFIWFRIFKLDPYGVAFADDLENIENIEENLLQALKTINEIKKKETNNARND